MATRPGNRWLCARGPAAHRTHPFACCGCSFQEEIQQEAQEHGL